MRILYRSIGEGEPPINGGGLHDILTFIVSTVVITGAIYAGTLSALIVT